MTGIPESRRNEVIRRAGARCEYCLLTSRFQVGRFEIDHIHPVSAGGRNSEDNLAFACPVCNGRKLNYFDGLDPETSKKAPLFHPRTQHWHDHFLWSVDTPFLLTGKNSCGTAIIQRLDLNDPDMMRLRSPYAELGYDCTKTDFE